MPHPLHDDLQSLPLIAILRGIAPHEVEAVGDALIDAGFRIIEVPLNSPDPFESIRLLRKIAPDPVLVGAGTVLSADDVDAVLRAGGNLIVSPNMDSQVIRRSKDLGAVSLPGVMTPSEAFAALKAGADGLKLFPCEMISPEAVKAMRAVLPPAAPLFAVGGIGPQNMAAYRAAGVQGFGLGSALYKAGDKAAAVAEKAHAFTAAWRSLTA